MPLQAHIQQGVFMIVCVDCQPEEISVEGKAQQIKQELEAPMFSRQVCASALPTSPLTACMLKTRFQATEFLSP
jgi:hypothetical protein